jgi:hypothetical protein
MRAYILEWDPPWEYPNIFLEYSVNGTNWEWYTGYLQHYGSITSPVYNMYYQMKTCDGQLCTVGGWAFIPNDPCTGPQDG